MISKQTLIGAGLAFWLSGATCFAQTVELHLDDFTGNLGSWFEAEEAWTDPLGDQEIFSAGQGSILVNQPSKKKKGMDLVSKETFGDAEVTLVYMMAPGSNSGLYLQGQYEIQLLDSWGKVQVRSGDNGGIYQRWDGSRPDGFKGYEGKAPRQNASKAPGLWQELIVRFKAPRFSDTGTKIANARIESVRLNGVEIHKGQELMGATAGALQGGEVAAGPIRIQGDHGPLAIKSLHVKRMDRQAPVFSNIHYEVYPGVYETLTDLDASPAVEKRSIERFDQFSTGINQESISVLDATLHIHEAGTYAFDFQVPGGWGTLEVNKESSKPMNGQAKLETFLEAGTYPVRLYISKTKDWTTEGFFLDISADGMWETSYSKPAGLDSWSVDPILVDTQSSPVVRSFIEVPDGPAISHGISISSPWGAHYSYDLTSNQLLRVWRGGFLDATPMWNDRGNGISRPLGVVTNLSKGEALFYDSDFQPLSTQWTPKGYQLLQPGAIEINGMRDTSTLMDRIQLLQDGKILSRELSAGGLPSGTLIKIAPGSNLKEVEKGMYWIQDAGMYLKVSTAQPLTKAGWIFLPFQGSLRYELIF